MNPTTTLHRFRLELSDVDRGVYESLDFRLAKHPSETGPYLLTRVFAYALNWQPGLEFSAGGLSDPDTPALFFKHANGRIELWIEIGNPTSKKLHKASKACPAVKVYTYKDPELLLREAKTAQIHRAEHIEIVSFKNEFLERWSSDLPKDVRWSILANDRVLTVNAQDKSESTEYRVLKIDP